jgi:TolB protein
MGLLLALALAFLAITAACSVTNPFVPTPSLGLIAYVGLDKNIYTIDRDGKHKSAITQDADYNAATDQANRVYQLPTWSPDGRRLAFVSLTSADPGTQASLMTSLSDGTQHTTAFTSQVSLPFYLFWSPNSQSITFLANDTGGAGFAMYMTPSTGSDSQVIGTGNPYYWDWSPDNRALIVHTGGAASDNPDARLALIELGDKVQTTPLDLKPGPFQAPAWSPAGDDLALAAQNDAGDGQLVLAGRDGKVKQVLAQLSGSAAFAWSPKGGQLAYTTQVQAETGPAVRLTLLDSAQPDRTKEVFQGDLVAFFWSPDGRKIAYFSLASQPPGSTTMTAQKIAPKPQTTSQATLVVHIYDLASGASQQIASIVPTDALLQVLPFYDQYQRSGTIWSPDSQNLVLAGLDAAGASAIYVAGVDGSPIHKIADGDLAFWSWK